MIFKKSILIILSIIIKSNLFSQHIKVKSFLMLEKDMDARITHAKIDQNGRKAAIIKIVTIEKGFVFEGGSHGIVASEQKIGEVWVWIPCKAKHITLKHENLGEVRDYLFPEEILEATVYEMILITKKNEPIIIEESHALWVVINSQPDSAIVYIDNKVTGQTPFQQEMKEGRYNYRVTKDFYHSTAGQFDLLGSTGKKTMNLKLRPNFGTAKISTSPQSGAQITLDGQLLQSQTPFTLDKIKSGKHNIVLTLPKYESAKKVFTIKDGLVTNVKVRMKPMSRIVSITSTPEADIYIDNKKVATGNYKGLISSGQHTVEGRKESHISDLKKIELQTGETKLINLQPTPVYGSLKIQTTPFDATITLNGEIKGTTPSTLHNLLIGDYSLVLSKTGYAPTRKKICITKNHETLVNEILTDSLTVSITPEPSTAQIYIDGILKGTGPIIETLNFGSHIIKLADVDKYKDTENIITVLPGGKEAYTLKMNLAPFVDKRDGKSYKLVKIGNQVWMAENLAYKTRGCRVYNKEKSNIAKYGYLYRWKKAQKVCPSGWHLPTKEEFETLLTNVGGHESFAYLALIPSGSSGFLASCGGYLSARNYFTSLGLYGRFWSSQSKFIDTYSYFWSARKTSKAWCLKISKKNEKAYVCSKSMWAGLSVRCVKDN